MDLVPHNRLTFGDAEARAVERVVRSGHWVEGPVVARLEARLAELTGRRHAVCVASGLSALRLSLLALGLGRRAPVAIPGYCCVALPNAILAAGGRPAPVDIRLTDFNLDPGKLGAKAKAVVAVHTFGAPAELAALAGVPLVEDCAHALGFGFGGRSDVAIASFYATKLIAAGQGGAVLTDRADITDRIRRSRDYSDHEPSAGRMNDRMLDLNAALALAQLDRFNRMIAARERLARFYTDRFDTLAEQGLIALPPSVGGRIWYRYAVRLLRAEADPVIAALRVEGIAAAKPVWDWRPPAWRRQTPIASQAYRRVISLPLYPTLAAAEARRVAEATIRVVRRTAR
ncbi:MAG: DegT/DnrJ/EryC1/StrS family aminotransferase [Pseudomonadota bacterium]